MKTVQSILESRIAVDFAHAVRESIAGRNPPPIHLSEYDAVDWEQALSLVLLDYEWGSDEIEATGADGGRYTAHDVWGILEDFRLLIVVDTDADSDLDADSDPEVIS